MQDFRNLRVWRAAHQLTLSIYAVTHAFPPDERFGLTSQARRAAASVPANIAEACGRGSDPDVARCLRIAMGSACELEYHLVLAGDLNLLKPDEYRVLTQALQELKRMLSRLLTKLAADSTSRRRPAPAAIFPLRDSAAGHRAQADSR